MQSARSGPAGVPFATGAAPACQVSPHQAGNPRAILAPELRRLEAPLAPPFWCALTLAGAPWLAGSAAQQALAGTLPTHPATCPRPAASACSITARTAPPFGITFGWSRCAPPAARSTTLWVSAAWPVCNVLIQGRLKADGPSPSKALSPHAVPPGRQAPRPDRPGTGSPPGLACAAPATAVQLPQLRGDRHVVSPPPPTPTPTTRAPAAVQACRRT